MAVSWAFTARQVNQLGRISSHKIAGASPNPLPTSFIHRRGLAGAGGDHHGPPKVNFWQDPLNPSKWKEEHFVIASLAGLGGLFYGGYKFFTRGKNEEKKDDPLRFTENCWACFADEITKLVPNSWF